MCDAIPLHALADCATQAVGSVERAGDKKTTFSWKAEALRVKPRRVAVAVQQKYLVSTHSFIHKYETIAP